MEILLDISRTIARARLPQPTGIDRVERAYIDWALGREARFWALVDGQGLLLDTSGMREILAAIDGQVASHALDWRTRLAPRRDLALRRVQALVRRVSEMRLFPSSIAKGLAPVISGPGCYLNVGHDNLNVPWIDALRHAGLRSVVLLHDVIPLDFPEYTRDGTPARFRAKFEAALHADALIFNSGYTRARVTHHARETLPEHVVLPLGVTIAAPVGAPQISVPTFAVLGTIEPRKNHVLLFRVWRALHQRLGPATPHLRIVGRRGWARPEILSVLDRDPLMGEVMFEDGPLPDAEVAGLLGGCRALLFPTFAEGYGLPIAEALQMGVPVIASDLPALREVAGDVPEWLDPGTDAGWIEAILNYLPDLSPHRTAQLSRLAGWQPPMWTSHFEGLENLLETIMVQPGRAG